MIDAIALVFVAVFAAGFAYLLGYDAGYKTSRRNAAASLRYSAALRSSPLLATPTSKAKADVLNEWADRWDQ